MLVGMCKVAAVLTSQSRDNVMQGVKECQFGNLNTAFPHKTVVTVTSNSMRVDARVPRQHAIQQQSNR